MHVDAAEAFMDMKTSDGSQAAVGRVECRGHWSSSSKLQKSMAHVYQAKHMLFVPVPTAVPTFI